MLLAQFLKGVTRWSCGGLQPLEFALKSRPICWTKVRLIEGPLQTSDLIGAASPLMVFQVLLRVIGILAGRTRPMLRREPPPAVCSNARRFERTVLFRMVQ